MSVSQAFDTSDSMGRMVLNILLTFSQFEREMIGERTREGLHARKRHGMIHGGREPFGYYNENGELAVDENEAEIVRFIFDEFIRTERYGAVIEAVEARDYRSSIKTLKKGGTRGGTRITSALVWGIIQNPVYVGEIKGGSSNYKARHRALVSREVWEAAQNLARARRKQGPSPKGTQHFLAGRLKDEFGRQMLLDLARHASPENSYYASAKTKWAQANYIRSYRTHAGRLDALVKSAITDFLCDRIKLRRALFALGLAPDKLEQIAAFGVEASRRLKRTKSPQIQDVMEALTTQIELGEDHIVITIRVFELQRFLEWNDQTAFRGRPRDWPLSNADFDIKLDVRVLTSPRLPLVHVRTQHPEPSAIPDNGLMSLIQSARSAQRLLDNHRDLDIPALARKAQVRSTQFLRLLRLNYLAPDIVSAILDGMQPEGLTRMKLLKANIPTRWSLQRELLGFPAPTRHVDDRKGRPIWHQKANTPSAEAAAQPDANSTTS